MAEEKQIWEVKNLNLANEPVINTDEVGTSNN